MNQRLPEVKFQKYTLLDGSEQVLVQKVGDGSIIKRFDKTPIPQKPTDVVCPHFLELKWAYGCPYDCAWCFLKGTLRLLSTGTKPIVKDYCKIQKHLESFFENDGHSRETLNTGELADSLMTENTNKPFSRFIIPLFEEQEQHKVLFLTKSNIIKNFVKIKNHNQVIVSFSLNAPSVARKWEKAPPIKERLRAAKVLEELSYGVRVRIDPIVPIEEWQREYLGLIDMIFENFVPERITFGSLRGLQSTINNVKDKSWTAFLTETSNWGKKIAFETRYLIYSALIRYLKSKYNYTKVALCKETVEMWAALHMDFRKIRCNCLI
jgi:spore photoproduct lyase